MQSVIHYFNVLLLLLVLSCKNQELPMMVPEPPVPPVAYSYLALGDSYTIGESVAEAERYPHQLADSLAKYGVSIERVDIVAQTGWRTDQLEDAIEGNSALAETYDLVSLLIGVNNQFQGRPIAVYEQDFRALLDRAIDFAEGDRARVFVVSIPDYAFTPFGDGRVNISEGVDAFNEVNASITQEYGITYFNITPISRRGLDEPALVADDGLHPSAIQYAEWVSLMIPEVVEKLKD
jgi:lysophospholipase L1-like esterase